MTTSFQFKPTQKFRIIVNDACFYGNARQIRDGIGDFTRCNDAILQALNSLEKMRTCDDIYSAARGLAGTWNGLNIQLNLA